MIKLLIARHGNTFDKGDIVTRVGLKTDMPLSTSGINQAKALGLYIKNHYQKIDNVFCSELQRTQQTADIALTQAGFTPSITPLSVFNEVDYGPDENQAEEKVVARVGQDAIKAWDEKAILPKGWQLDIDKTKTDLSLFLQKLTLSANSTTLIVTSNGIARFFPLLSNVIRQETLKLKLPTASLCQLTYTNEKWIIDFWGKKPFTVST